MREEGKKWQQVPTAFSPGLSYTACPCPTVQSYPPPSSSGKQDLPPTHGFVDAGLACTSTRGLSGACQRHRLFLGTDHPTRCGQRKVALLLTDEGLGEGCLQPGALAGSMAEGHLPTAAVPWHSQQLMTQGQKQLCWEALLSHRRLPNHFLCISLPSFLTLPQLFDIPTDLGAVDGKGVSIHLYHLASAPSAFSITHTLSFPSCRQ